MQQVGLFHSVLHITLFFGVYVCRILHCPFQEAGLTHLGLLQLPGIKFLQEYSECYCTEQERNYINS